MNIGIILIGIFLIGCKAYNISHRSYGSKYHQEYEPFHDVIAVTEPDAQDHYYTRYKPEKGFDLTSLGILAIIKLLLLKAKGMGLILLLLLKLPLIFFLIIGKFIVAFKAVKFVKLFAIPFVLLGLLPLLLGPLMFLGPLLIPLLLFLPIPVLASNTTTASPVAPGRRRRDVSEHLGLLRRIMYSEMCIERIACRLASGNEPIYNSAISWSLNEINHYVTHSKLSSYINAYKSSADLQSHEDKCSQKYQCNNYYLKSI